MANTYSVGQVVRLSANFQTASADVDPTTVAITIREPNGNRTTYTYVTDAAVVKDSTGDYHLDYTVTMPGTHWYRWFSTGTGAGAGEVHFLVSPLQVQP